MNACGHKPRLDTEGFHADQYHCSCAQQITESHSISTVAACVVHTECKFGLQMVEAEGETAEHGAPHPSTVAPPLLVGRQTAAGLTAVLCARR